MSSVSDDQKELLFDYSLGLTSEAETARAKALIASNSEAAEIYNSLRAVFAPLESLELQKCPEELAERTIARIASLANSGHRDLDRLIAAEQVRPATAKLWSWRNLGEVVAVAAAVLLIATILLPVMGRQRQAYWKQRCQSQLSSIFRGLSSYVADHDGRPPAVTVQPGQRWNTRRIYLPVKLGYIKNVAVFVCPGRSRGGISTFDTSTATEYDDFPTRDYITYSPRKPCPDALKKRGLCAGPILADRNPIFDEPSFVAFRKQLNQILLTINSRNHRGKGQNLLYGDGHVQFFTTRHVGSTDDDIFAVREMCCGLELGEREVLPTSEGDIFLAP